MNTDLLKYDAASIRELCRRKLLESGAYTDQIYPGSDISIIIDIFSWTFNVLTYMLNQNASDVLFSDSEVYENLNKAVKLLSYNPKAYITSTAEFNIDLNNSTEFQGQTITCVIPRFASIITNKQDDVGNEVRYSFTEDYSFNIVNGILVLPKIRPSLSNGIFTKYTFDNKATGKTFEIFSMNDVGPNSNPKTLVDNDNMHVFIENTSDDGIRTYQEVTIVKSLILDASASDVACECRVNEDKEIELKFGDGIHGRRLSKGDTIHMIYLKSNGKYGIIDSGEMSTNLITLKINGFSSNEEMIDMAYGGSDMFLQMYSALFSNGYIPIFDIKSLIFSNPHKSTDPVDYEDILEIRENAPSSFRIGNRLVTANDFRTYILDRFKTSYKDAYVCNNNEYCALFYKWLDKYDSLNLSIRLKNYEYANACDFNNIYIFLNSSKAEGLTELDRSLLVKECERLKPLTSNIVPCEGLRVDFIPFVRPSNNQEVDLSKMTSDPFSYASKIVIKKGSTFYSDAKIKSFIVDIIINYFKEHSHFGEKINLADIQQQILALGYIESIHTVSVDSSDTVNNHYMNYVKGLSFAKFTSDLIDAKDFECFTQIVELEKFQYGRLINPESLIGLIEIVNDNNFMLKSSEF